MDLKKFQQEMKKDCIISNRHVYVEPDTLQPGQTQCPKCGKIYTKAHADSCAGTATEREQHISGICSDECWTKGLTK